MLTSQGPPNNSFDPTGYSTAFIESLLLAQVLPGGSIRALDTLRKTKLLRPVWRSQNNEGSLE
jgi:hypothetical protein